MQLFGAVKTKRRGPALPGSLPAPEGPGRTPALGNRSLGKDLRMNLRLENFPVIFMGTKVNHLWPRV